MQQFGASRPTVCKARPTRPLFRSSCRVRQAIVEMPAESPVSGRRDHSKPSASNCHCQAARPLDTSSDSPVSEVAAPQLRQDVGGRDEVVCHGIAGSQGCAKSGSRPPLGVRAGARFASAHLGCRPSARLPTRLVDRASCRPEAADRRMGRTRLGQIGMAQHRSRCHTMLSLRVVPTGLAQVGLVAALTPTWGLEASAASLSRTRTWAFW